MKVITTKELVSLVGIAVAAPVLALAVVVGAHSVGVAANELFLLALALGGAVLSGVNGFGRRTVKDSNHLSGGSKATLRSGLPS